LNIKIKKKEIKSIIYKKNKNIFINNVFYLYILKKKLTNRVINTVLLVIFNIKIDFFVYKLMK
jgi:hypothetical protein